MLDYEITRFLSLFENKTDRAGTPYVDHLYYVANSVAYLGDEYYYVGLLHDLLEDTPTTYEDLIEANIPVAIANAILAITKLENEPYDVYLERVKYNHVARIVKLADLEHNMDLSRLPSITDRDLARKAKYQRAVEFLTIESV